MEEVLVVSKDPAVRRITAEEVWAKLKSAQDLPTLPKVANKVVRMAVDPNVSLREVARVVESDPALAFKILKVVNSAFYGFSREIGSISLAVNILGTREVILLTLGVSVFSAFPPVPGKPSFDREAFWRHSIGCGAIARALEERFRKGGYDELFSGGLLHDIGKVLLDQYFHLEFLEALDISWRERIPMEEAELKVFGTTHEEVGGWLAERWQLPEGLVACIRYHHRPFEAPPEYREEVGFVHIADILTKASGVGLGGDNVGFSLMHDAVWKKFAEDLGEVDIERLTFEMEDEIEKAEAFMELSIEDTSKEENC